MGFQQENHQLANLNPRRRQKASTHTEKPVANEPRTKRSNGPRTHYKSTSSVT